MLNTLRKNYSQETKIDYELIDILRIIRTENIGPKTFFELYKIYKDFAKVIEVMPELSIRGGKKKPLAVPTQEEIQKEIDATLSYGAKYLKFSDHNYPTLLKQVDSRPPVLIAYGNSDLSDIKNISMVGSRNASQNGCFFARKLASDLGKREYKIVSGLARGIDKFAHSGSLETGTIAVVAGGVDVVYPQENVELYNQIIQNNGTIIAEMPFGVAPISKHFPLRNRIISGISLATIVVEASLSSGSLITAYNALGQHREVFAVPGFPADPRSKGTNKLIKEGAYIVETYEDVITVLERINYEKFNLNEPETFFESAHNIRSNDTAKIREIILEKLNHTPINFEDLINEIGEDISLIYLAIIELELAGRVSRHSGNKISLILDGEY